MNENDRYGYGVGMSGPAENEQDAGMGAGVVPDRIDHNQDNEDGDVSEQDAQALAAALADWEDPLEEIRRKMREKKRVLRQLQREVEQLENESRKRLSPSSPEIREIAKMVTALTKETPYSAEAIVAMTLAATKKIPSAGRKGAAVAPKYRNPNNPEQTWTGRGRKPQWVVELLDRGYTLDRLKITD